MTFRTFQLFVFSLLLCTFSFYGKAQEFVKIPDQNLLLLTTEAGEIYIELAPEMAPNHVARFLALHSKQAYDNTEFYRVIDGFVAQAGPGGKGEQNYAPLKLEAKHSTKNLEYSLVQERDLFAAFTAFSQGFAIALNDTQSEFWLAHCPGVVAMARGNEADSATTDFYITIGQAPRYLDRIMTIFGRVIFGMDVVQRIQRGVIGEDGLFPNKQAPTKIISTTLVSELPANKRPVIRVEKTHGEQFESKLTARKHRSHPFFFEKPPAVLDVCQVPLAVQFEAPSQN